MAESEDLSDSSDNSQIYLLSKEREKEETEKNDKNGKNNEEIKICFKKGTNHGDVDKGESNSEKRETNQSIPKCVSMVMGKSASCTDTSPKRHCHPQSDGKKPGQSNNGEHPRVEAVFHYVNSAFQPTSKNSITTQDKISVLKNDTPVSRALGARYSDFTCMLNDSQNLSFHVYGNNIKLDINHHKAGPASSEDILTKSHKNQVDSCNKCYEDREENILGCCCHETDSWISLQLKSPTNLSPTSTSSSVHKESPTKSSSNQQACNSLTRLSVMSSDSVICRICHEGENKETLIAPCRCTGTMGRIHLTCIEKWLSSRNTSKCEICGYHFETERKPRPFTDWLRNPGSHSDKRNLIADSTCFLLLTPLAAVSAWLCITGATHYSKFNRGSWESVGLVTLSIFLIIIYLIWCAVAIRYHAKVFRDWKAHNQLVKVCGMSKRPKAPSDQTRNNTADSVQQPLMQDQLNSNRASPHTGDYTHTSSQLFYSVTGFPENSLGYTTQSGTNIHNQLHQVKSNNGVNPYQLQDSQVPWSVGVHSLPRPIDGLSSQDTIRCEPLTVTRIIRETYV